MANDLVVKTISALGKEFDGVLLDGYPRTVQQAKFLDKSYENRTIYPLKVLNVKLAHNVAVAKLLGRRQCVTCNTSFNMAHIVEDGYDMPAILPSSDSCKFGPTNCNPELEKRDDDTEETIRVRMQQHDANAAPILAYYDAQGVLATFNVLKGIKDAPALIDMINK
jgi:adenylate kinase